MAKRKISSDEEDELVQESSDSEAPKAKAKAKAKARTLIHRFSSTQLTRLRFI